MDNGTQVVHLGVLTKTSIKFRLTTQLLRRYRAPPTTFASASPHQPAPRPTAQPQTTVLASVGQKVGAQQRLVCTATLPTTNALLWPFQTAP